MGRSNHDHREVFLAGFGFWATLRRASALITGAALSSAAAADALSFDPQALAALGVAPPTTQAEIALADLRAHVEVLAGEAMEGRLAGAPGARAATAYAAALFQRYGLEPAAPGGGYFHEFQFPSGIALKPGAALTLEAETDRPEALALDQDWRPLGFSQNADAAPMPIVFAGYGLATRRRGALPRYDSFTGATEADLSGAWVLIWRGAPPKATGARRSQLLRVAGMRYKASIAKARGAAGVILAAGPGAGYAGELPPLRLAAMGRRAGLPVLALSRGAAERVLRAGGLDPAAEAARLADGAAPRRPRTLEGVRLSATMTLTRLYKTGRNVIARLRLSDGDQPPAMLGAHIDHLGRGGEASSLARPAEAGMIHFGADDNASGVAALLEIAESLAAARDAGALTAERDLLFAAWSAEELGLIGATRYVEAAREAAGRDTLKGVIAAYLNMDMVGRLEDRLELAGLGSSPIWRGAAARAAGAFGRPIVSSEEVYLPTDATAFYLAGAPILSASTGTHPQYHTPRDTPDLINYEGLAGVARFMRDVALEVAQAAAAPAYIAVSPPEQGFQRPGGLYLGAIPEFAQDPMEAGVSLAGVVAEGPAAAAGLRGGDRLLSLGGQPISDLYDLVRVLDALTPDQPVPAVVERGGARVSLQVTPRWRD
ncbi:MAG: M28 family peptidase [Pseudomonadota bacterium]